MSEPLTVSGLDIALNDLVQWERFAHHLPRITPNTVETIKIDKRDDKVEQKLALYKEWLERYPEGTWEDIIGALYKAKHIYLAEKLKEKHTTTTTPLQEGVEIKVQESVVNELDKLQQSFKTLVSDVKQGINEAVECGKMSVSKLVDDTEEERAFTIPQLQTVQTTNDYFNAIRPHYTFLNCHLLVCVALMLLDPIRAAANEYKGKVDTLKKNTAVKRFKDTLEQYYPTEELDTMIKVKIILKDTWGRENIWLVEELVRKLFDLRHPDECQWFRVVPGSVMVVFLAPKHMMMSMIVSASKRRGLMMILGVNAISVGECLILMRDEEMKQFDIITSLLYDVQNGYDTTELLLKRAKSDLNRAIQIKELDQTSHMHSSLLSDDRNAEMDFKIFKEYIENEFPLLIPDFEIEVSSGRLTLESLVTCVNESIVCPIEGLANVRSAHELFQVIQPYYTFLNSHILQQLALQLSGLNAYVAYKMLLSVKTTKEGAELSGIMKPIENYIDASNISPNMMMVTLTFDDTWQTATMDAVEQLIQFLFGLKHPDELLWHRVRYGSVIIEFLAPKNMMMYLITNSVKQKQLMTLTGVMRLQIGNIVIHKTTQQLTPAELRAESRNLQSTKALAIYTAYDTQRRSIASLEIKDNNCNLTYVNHSTFTCLMIACMHGEAHLAKLLLKCGADPNHRNAHGYTSFLYASEIGNTKIMELLLQYGADINTQKENGDTALVCATRTGNVHTVNFLIKRKADLKAPDGSTVLHIATAKGHSEIVLKLLKEGMDPNHCDNNNSTCLHMAVTHTNVLEVLLKMKVDVNAQDSLGKTPLAYASAVGNWMAVDQLLNAGANPEIAEYNTLKVPLHLASHVGHHHIVKRLLEANVNVNIQDIALSTPLTYAAIMGHKEVVKILLKAKADPNIQGMTDNCLLANVSETGNADMVEFLLENGADLYSAFSDGSTSLHAACRTGHLKVVDLLLKKGLNPNTIQELGINSLHAACRYGQPHIVDRLLKENMNLEAKTNNGLTALQIAIFNRHFSIAHKLLQAGADPSIPDSFIRK